MRLRLIWMLLAVIFTLTLLLGYRSYVLLEKNVLEDSEAKQHAISHAAAALVQSYVHDRMEDVMRIAKLPEIELYRVTYNAEPALEQFEQYGDAYQEIAYISDQGLRMFGVTQGVAELRAFEMADSDFYQSLLKHPNQVYIRLPSPEENARRPLIRLGFHHINYFDEAIGSVMVELSPDTLNAMLQSLDLDEGTQLYVTHASGGVIASTDSVIEGSSAQQQALFRHIGEKLRHPNVEHHFLELQQPDIYVSGVSLDDWQWNVLVTTSKDVVRRPLHQLINEIIAAILVALFVGGCIAYVIGRQTLKPLQLLTTAATSAANNFSLAQRVEWHSRDELGGLASTFNAMLDRLQHAIFVLKQNENCLQEAQKLARVGYLRWFVGVDRIEVSNELQRILGTEPPNIDGFFARIHKDDRHYFQEITRTAVQRRAPGMGECRIITEGNHTCYVQFNLNVQVEQEDLILICTVQDITALKRSQQELKFLAYNDELTGLPNRAMLKERLDQAIHTANLQASRIAVLFLDLDHFKQINDTFGHPMGDEVLVAVAERLNQCVPCCGCLYRLGGDEFVVLLEGYESRDEVTELAEAILYRFEERFVVHHERFAIGTSIGISTYPYDGTTVQDLMKDADAAMYQAKEEGRNNYLFYREEFTEALRKQLVLTRELKEALEHDQLYLNYQPQIDGADQRIKGFEVLVRWQHPEKGFISPADFIPMAERSDLILRIGSYVLEQACKQLAFWRQRGFPEIRLAVNLSAQQVSQPDLVDQVQAVLVKYQLSPELIELEITEGSLVSRDGDIVKQLKALQALGVTLAIDDFGTGYSSLSYLKQLPIDKLKIDQSFVRGLPEDQDDQSIVRAIIALGQSLDMKLIAEGVETSEQRDYLYQAGCFEFQGYYFSRPVGGAEAEKLIMMGRFAEQEEALVE